MKSFLKNLCLVFLGVVISVATTSFLPAQIRAVTASLSTTTIKPLDAPSASLSQFPESSRILETVTPFALPAIPMHNNGYPIQIDMNGDGLLDLVYSTVYTSGASQYVLLNNGQGFDAAYLCNKSFVATRTPQHVYRGHCADPNFTL